MQQQGLPGVCHSVRPQKNMIITCTLFFTALERAGLERNPDKCCLNTLKIKLALVNKKRHFNKALPFYHC